MLLATMDAFCTVSLETPLTFKHMTVVFQPRCQDLSASRLFEQYSIYYKLYLTKHCNKLDTIT